MTRNDLESVLHLENQFGCSHWNETHFTSDIEDNRYALPVVYRLNGNITAYSCCKLLADELEITNIVVDPNYRRQGFAKSLLQQQFKWSVTLGAIKCFLEVKKSNTNAINLYFGLGFSKIGLRAGYYKDGEDALILCRQYD